MSLRSTILRHGVEYSVSRPGAQVDDGFGRVTPGAPSTVLVTIYTEPGSSNALEGLDRGLQVVSELQRTQKVRVCYAYSELRERDSFTYDGDTYDIVLADKVDGLSGAPHWIAVAAKRVT